MIITEDMIFDTKTKRMRLTNDYVYNELGIDLANALIDEFDTNLSTIAERTLKYTSDQLYNYLKAKGVKIKTMNAYDTACYLIATNQEWYDAFKEALGYQLNKFILVGDVDDGTENWLSRRAKDLMISTGMFHTLLRDIPEVARW